MNPVLPTLLLRNDGFSWNRTLNTALSENPDVNFVISAGDQVNKTGEAKEEEYASYLSADALKSLPVATTIGKPRFPES